LESILVHEEPRKVLRRGMISYDGHCYLLTISEVSITLERKTALYSYKPSPGSPEFEGGTDHDH